MVDDFWGDRELENVAAQFAPVLPDQKPRELPLSHEIFHNVYKLEEKPQVPSIRHWRAGRSFEDHGPGSDDGPNFRGIFDDDGRLTRISHRGGNSWAPQRI